MDNNYNPSSSYPYNTAYGYPYVPRPYPNPNSGILHRHILAIFPIHQNPSFSPPPAAIPSPQASFQHQGSFQYSSSHHHHHQPSMSLPFSTPESYSDVPSRVNSFSGYHRQDSTSSVGTGSTTNHDNASDSTPSYPSVYPLIDDLLANVHISSDATSVPASPQAISMTSSPTWYSQSEKYDTQGSIHGYYNASHSGPIDSSAHPALSHSTSFADSPHSQNLQIVPVSNSKGSLKVLLLHGNLDIWVYEAKNLPNMDMFHKTLGDVFGKLPGNMSSKIEGTMNHKITSDPYVSISVSSAVIGRTYVINNNENPVWMQRFYIPVAHYAAEVKFFVKDSDVVGSQLMGVVAIPVEQIYSGVKVQGLYPILNNNGKPCKPGAVLSISIQYTPIERLSIYHHGVGAGPDYVGVPGTYFPLRRGGKVTLYQDAHVPDDFFPNLKLDRGLQYVQGKCWHDIFNAISRARRLIYITGWSVWHKVRLVRDADYTSNCTLGDLLKSKSQEGVRVLLLVWDDPTSRSILGYKTDGIMQTHDEETRRFFKHSSVQVLLCPRVAGKKHSWIKQRVFWWFGVCVEAYVLASIRLRKVETIYTHHQKTVIVDADAGDNRRRIIAFLGGLDLCDGRYDTQQHPIFRTLETVHKDDYHNPTYTGNTAGCPREPWHDLHCKIDGPAAYDVLTNFEERWLKASKPHVRMILRGWHVQIFRSIDSNSVRKFPNDPKEAISKNLMCGKNVLIDMSIHTAYVKAIRAAQHFIYIENQYFIGSSYNWSSYKDVGANNLIPMEIALKIAEKIKAHERFAVYIVVPMWPEGNPTGAATQRILFWQHKTMQMMYETIYKALVEVGLEGTFTPQDYLNFFCLGNREDMGSDSSSTESSTTNTPQALSRKNRRFMIYVHSKGMIVDDEYVILGSANINQRSMEGTRDTEIAMGAYQPHHTWARKLSNPRGQIYGYRMSLWAEHLGIIEECFAVPESIDCVRTVRSMGEANWKQFAAEKVTEMRAHLLKYPVEVDQKGKVKPLPGCECFPDVGGQIVGSFLAIQENLTI
ncbi:phospholipase D beta 1 [Actinidia rufa]|uniref:Phospholipase D alpha 1 n=1 Tax=Actinidia rufa TaxID=165716 RepID=A0A7J0F3D3_9ERIC|nr:phospholipase D beta 1 [Actinidia rufa]